MSRPNTTRCPSVRAFISALIARAYRPARGQGLVEYALILAFIGLVVIVALQAFTPHITDTFTHVGNCLDTMQTPVATAVATATTNPC